MREAVTHRRGMEGGAAQPSERSGAFWNLSQDSPDCNGRVRSALPAAARRVKEDCISVPRALCSHVQVIQTAGRKSNSPRDSCDKLCTEGGEHGAVLLVND